jgi:hypothetical protein
VIIFMLEECMAHTLIREVLQPIVWQNW